MKLRRFKERLEVAYIYTLWTLTVIMILAVLAFFIWLHMTPIGVVIATGLLVNAWLKTIGR